MSGTNNSNLIFLWNTFLKGDDKAFAGIYYAFADTLLSYGKKLTRDTELVHDAMQEIFIDLFQKRGKQHNPISNPKAYLLISLKNGILKKLLEKRKFNNQEVDDIIMGEFRIEYSFQDEMINREITEEKRIKLQKAIITLSPGQKEIIYLKFEEELGYAEIAELLSITVESARKQLYRALLSLRHTFDTESLTTLFLLFRKKD